MQNNINFQTMQEKFLEMIKKFDKSFYNRLKIIAKVRTDSDLAKWLGITKGTLSVWIKNEDFNFNHFYDKKGNLSVNINWLITGEGEPYSTFVYAENETKNNVVKEAYAKYESVKSENTYLKDELKKTETEIQKDNIETASNLLEIAKLKAVIEEKESTINKLFGLIAKNT